MTSTLVAAQSPIVAASLPVGTPWRLVSWRLRARLHVPPISPVRDEQALGGLDGAGGVVDTFSSYVWEPSLVKINALTAATEAATLVLSVDETVRNPKSEQPDGHAAAAAMAGRGGGRGRGRGRGMRR
jgi:hypothetical protein